MGKVYQDARGFLRMSATFDGPENLALKLAPEIHHGPSSRGWGVAEGATPQAPRQFIIKNGQQEETFRDVACTLAIKPGQVVAISARSDRRGSLGDFLFSESEGNSDRPMRKVVFVWLARSEAPPNTPSGLVPIEPSADLSGAPQSKSTP